MYKADSLCQGPTGRDAKGKLPPSITFDGLIKQRNQMQPGLDPSYSLQLLVHRVHSAALSLLLPHFCMDAASGLRIKKKWILFILLYQFMGGSGSCLLDVLGPTESKRGCNYSLFLTHQFAI